MRNLLAIALFAFVLSHSAKAEPYQWTLSASDAHPFANTGAPSPGLQILHLWFACSEFGASAAEFSLEFSPSANLLQVIPVGPCTFVPTGGGLLFGLGGCASAPVRVAELVVLDTGAGYAACFAPSPANGILATVDCPPTSLPHPMAYVGFASNGEAPCREGECPGAVPVAPRSWGAVKALYP